jgi:hypothetical protein
MSGPRSLEANQSIKGPLNDTSEKSPAPSPEETPNTHEVLQQRNFLDTLKETIEDRITRSIDERRPAIKRTDFILLTDRL